MPSAVRIGDPVSCGDTMAQGSGNVFANGIPFTRKSVDNTASHCFNPTPISSASPDVWINVGSGGEAAVRVGDPIVPHSCPPASHGGNMADGSPNVFVNSGSGVGAIIDNNPTYDTPGIDPPPNVNPNPPVGTTAADVYVYENNDVPVADGGVVNALPPPNTEAQTMSTVEEDPTQPPPEIPPVQDCSVVDSLPSNFVYTDQNTDFGIWAAGFALSANFTVADMCFGAVGSYTFTASSVQASGLTQKQILLNMCHHAKTVLEPMLAAYGPFTITSGFRNKSGGSQHNKGQATDIQFPGKTGTEYYETAQDIRDNINFDQMILEWFGRNPWIHVSSNPGSHRKQVLTQVGRNSYDAGLKLLRA